MCCHCSKCYKRKNVSKCWFTSTWCRWFFECSVIIDTFNMNVSVLTVVQEVKTTANIITFMRINIKTKESLFYFLPNWLNYYIIRNYEKIYIYIDYYFFHYHWLLHRQEAFIAGQSYCEIMIMHWWCLKFFVGVIKLFITFKFICKVSKKKRLMALLLLWGFFFRFSRYF